MEATFVADDGLVHAALVALALVVCLRIAKFGKGGLADLDGVNQLGSQVPQYSPSLLAPQTE